MTQKDYGEAVIRATFKALSPPPLLPPEPPKEPEPEPMQYEYFGHIWTGP